MAALAQTSMVLKAPAMQAASTKVASSRMAAFNGKAISARSKVAISTQKAGAMEISSNLKVLRDRIESVKSTQKITDAMKLVAAAKVRRAQEAVLGGRPFSENLVKVLFAVNTRLQGEDVDVPLTAVRPVKSVLLVCCTGDRGLCGGFNNFVIKKTEARIAELEKMGIAVTLVAVGKKGAQYFKRRP
eukprot:2508357-Pyramimonas_sp.AAC.1